MILDVTTELNSELCPYRSEPTAKNCAQWLAFIRLFCYVRTPACVYSKIETPYSHLTFRTTRIVPLPDYVSNLLADQINIISAREAATHRNSDEPLYSEFDVIPLDVTISSNYKPRGLEPYGISKNSVLRVGEELVAAGVGATGVESSTMRFELVRAVTTLGRGLVEPGPLWHEELRWLEKNGGQWLWGALFEEH